MSEPLIPWATAGKRVVPQDPPRTFSSQFSRHTVSAWNLWDVHVVAMPISEHPAWMRTGQPAGTFPAVANNP